jgi:hypothetical protein
MDDRGSRQGAAHHQEDNVAEGPAGRERHRRDQAQFRNRSYGAPSRNYREAGFDDVRDAIHRTYK